MIKVYEIIRIDYNGGVYTNCYTPPPGELPTPETWKKLIETLNDQSYDQEDKSPFEYIEDELEKLGWKPVEYMASTEIIED